MSGKKMPSWVIGCGIGCGVIVLIGAVLVGAGAVFIGRTVKGFDEADAARQKVEEAHGAPETFTPSPDGSIPPARMEAFLAVREALAPARDALAGTFERLPMSREEAEELDRKTGWEKFTSVLSIAGTAMGLGAEMGELFRARESAMLEAGIGMGEYEYIYTIAYYVWLGHSPSDSPHLGVRDRGEHGEFRMMGPRVMSRVRSDLIAMLRNQLAALPADASEEWRRGLSAEIEAMEKDGDRIPWEDGLPDPIAASLAPYRERLEKNYLPAANPFELARNRRRGRWSYTAD